MDTTRSASPRRARRYLYALFALLLTVSTLVAGATTTAKAAPTFDATGTVSNPKMSLTQFGNGWSLELTADWSFEDLSNSFTGVAGFSMALPPQLQGRGNTFNLTATDDPSLVIGKCTNGTTEVTCTLLNDYIQKNPKQLHGDMRFWVVVRDNVTEKTEKVYTIGGVEFPVTVLPPSGPCTTNCQWRWTWQKDGIVNYSNNTITWYIHIQATQDGFPVGTKITVNDKLLPNSGLKLDLENVGVMKTTTSGSTGPTSWSWMPKSSFTLDPATGEVSWLTEANTWYQVVYTTQILADTINGTQEFANEAFVKVGNEETVTVPGKTRYQGNSGRGIGTDFGGFSITKKVTGTATGLPADQEFTGTYAVTEPGNDTPKTGTWSVKAGETWNSPLFARDSTVVLTEDGVSTPSNVTWQPGVFSPSAKVTLPSGGRAEVTVTNEANIKQADFQASKVIAGDGASLVPGDTEFVLDYSYPAGEGFEAGSGSLTLKADGTPVTSPKLPVGAVVTVSEQTPPAVPGGTWGEATIDPVSFTVGEGDPVKVVVTNTFTKTPPPTPPTPPATTTPPKPPALPNTGA